MSGTRGPIPKRSDQRRRRNKEGGEVTKAPAASRTLPPVPSADENWHPAALAWYESLADSGQRMFYEASDWATAWLIAESISRDLKPQFVGVTDDGAPIFERIPMKGASLAAYLKAMSALLVTEGDRRRSRLELERAGSADEDEDAAVVAIDAYQKRLSG